MQQLWNYYSDSSIAKISLLLASFLAIAVPLLFYWLSRRQVLKADAEPEINLQPERLPIKIEVSNLGARPIRIKSVGFKLRFWASYEVVYQAELLKISQPMMPDGEIVRFSLDINPIFEQLKAGRRKIIEKGEAKETNRISPLTISIYTSTGKIFPVRIRHDLDKVFREKIIFFKNHADSQIQNS